MTVLHLPGEVQVLQDLLARRAARLGLLQPLQSLLLLVQRLRGFLRLVWILGLLQPVQPLGLLQPLQPLGLLQPVQQLLGLLQPVQPLGLRHLVQQLLGLLLLLLALGTLAVLGLRARPQALVVLLVGLVVRRDEQVLLRFVQLIAQNQLDALALLRDLLARLALVLRLV